MHLWPPTGFGLSATFVRVPLVTNRKVNQFKPYRIVLYLASWRWLFLMGMIRKSVLDVKVGVGRGT